MDLTKNIFKIITFFGNIIFSIFIIVLLYFLDKQKSYQLFVLVLISTIIAGIIRIIYFKKRPDNSPTNNLWLRLYNSSFPSIHAMRSIILAYLLSGIYPKIIFIIIFWILALLICYSRIYLKKHDFIDVLFGALIGLLLAFIVL